MVLSAPSTAAAPQMPLPTDVSSAVSLSIFSIRPIHTPPKMVTVTTMASMTMAETPTSKMSVSVRRKP